MSDVKLREALQRIANWNEHSIDFAVNYGSNGVRDYYRAIAEEALAHPTESAGLTDSEIESHEWLLSIDKSCELNGDDSFIVDGAKDFARAVIATHEAKRRQS